MSRSIQEILSELHGWGRKPTNKGKPILVCGVKSQDDALTRGNRYSALCFLTYHITNWL